jgi:hypothetical protein
VTRHSGRKPVEPLTQNGINRPSRNFTVIVDTAVLNDIE